MNYRYYCFGIRNAFYVKVMDRIPYIIRNGLLRIISVLFVYLVLFVTVPYSLSAGVKKSCSNCHTQHNSEDGKSVSGVASQAALLSIAGGTTCWGCHAQGGGYNIDPTTGTPQIDHQNAVDLAGGNFAYITGNKSGITGDSMTRGHNIIDTGITDSNFGNQSFPPGDAFSQHSEGFDNTTFTCAGKFGCHGDRTKSDEIEAIKGAHHTSDTVLKYGSINESLQGGTVGTSYRFLLGVKGGEDSDWEATVSGVDHNEYKGGTSGTEGTKVLPGGSTISGFCSECHGSFHGQPDDTGGGASPWKRHPTDVSLPGNGTEYAGYTAYNLNVPVARTDIPNSPGSEVNPDGTTNDIVMCLSCHRAHASPYSDSLRWNYDEMVAGGGGSGGCFACHTQKC